MDSGEVVRLRLDIAYDGGAFTGWGRQPGLRTVQGELEGALATLFRRTGPVPGLVVAGRTDAGVHATGQVAHLDLTPEQYATLTAPHRGTGATKGKRPRRPRPLGPEALARRLNGIAGLTSDLVVTAATLAPPGFDARFSAIWRVYEYRVADAAAPRNPLLRGHTLWYPSVLDVEAMNDASSALVGLHDFAAYCKPREGATTIRTLQEFSWRRDDEGVLLARVRADAFCHSMVRALVGAAIAVGDGTLTAERMRELLQSTTRTSEFKVVPARGLTLREVGYPADDELAARAEQTRARREAPARPQETQFDPTAEAD